MSQLLASDLNNPEFAGAINPDSLLHCEFYMHNPLDKWASEEASYKEGRNIRINKYKEAVPFCRIMKPGDNTSIITTEARDDHKRRFPNQWLKFQMDEGLINEAIGVHGTPLEDWPELKDQPEQIRDLKYKRFYTVEQIAGASDASVQGMGMGGLGFREKARQFLRGKVAADIHTEMQAKDKQLAEMQAQMKAMQEQMAALSAQKPAEPKRRKRRTKAEMIEDGKQHAA